MSEPFIGEIAIFAFGRAPVGFMPANGQALTINTYQALYALIGITYGGDGKTTFCLPNLNHGTMMGVNQTDADFPWGKQGGSATTTLTLNNLPAHSHTFNASTENATSHTPAGSLFATIPASGGDYVMYAPPSSPAITVAPASLTATGGGQPYSSMSPYIGLQLCICVDNGLFPPRP